MISKAQKIDRPFLISVIILITLGFVIFSSASLGLVTRDGAGYGAVATTQVASLIIGGIFCFIISRLNPKIFSRNAWVFFVLAVGANLLLFIPGLALEHGGATRWIDVGPLTFQPSEFLKIGTIIYCGAWLAFLRDKVEDFKKGIAIFLGIMASVSLLLVIQSDTDTLIVILASCTIMLFASGAKLKHIALIGLVGLMCLSVLIYLRPYAKERIMTFLNPNRDPQGASYQIQQSLIAIGSGGFVGRGFGQSIQKFNYLPEPIGDSIFAVASEEFGFIGSFIIVMLFVIFCMRGLKIANRAPDNFGRLITIGIVCLVVIESFMNMSSMLGIIPLSGMPLLFISHGGTAIVVTLCAVGIVFGVSRQGNAKIQRLQYNQQ